MVACIDFFEMSEIYRPKFIVRHSTFCFKSNELCINTFKMLFLPQRTFLINLFDEGAINTLEKLKFSKFGLLSPGFDVRRRTVRESVTCTPSSVSPPHSATGVHRTIE
jgi:hypothetical protein